MVPRTAIIYARALQRGELDEQVQELEDWCARTGVVPIDTVAEVTLGARTSKLCREVLDEVASGRVRLVVVRDLARLTENAEELREIVQTFGHQIAVSRDDLDPSR